MQIYIRTRWNPNNDTGIYWRKYVPEKNDLIIEEEPEALEIIESFGFDLSDTKQSIVIYNYDNKYCLFVDNIKSDFKDKANRPVKHTFLFVGKYEDEALYRKILYGYLSTNIFPINSFYIKEKNLIDFYISNSLSLGVFKLYKKEKEDCFNINSIESLKTSLVNNMLPVPQKNNTFWVNIGIFNNYDNEPFFYIRENIAKEKIDEIRQKFPRCCILNSMKGENNG